MASDSPTEDAMYGDVEVTRQGDPTNGPFTVVFRPYNQTAASTQSHTSENAATLRTLLRGLGLPDSEITNLCNGLQNSSSRWIKTLVPTAALKQYRLI